MLQTIKTLKSNERSRTRDGSWLAWPQGTSSRDGHGQSRDLRQRCGSSPEVKDSIRQLWEMTVRTRTAVGEIWPISSLLKSMQLWIESPKLLTQLSTCYGLHGESSCLQKQGTLWMWSLTLRLILKGRPLRIQHCSFPSNRWSGGSQNTLFPLWHCWKWDLGIPSTPTSLLRDKNVALHANSPICSPGVLLKE